MEATKADPREDAGGKRPTFFIANRASASSNSSTSSCSSSSSSSPWLTEKPEDSSEGSEAGQLAVEKLESTLSCYSLGKEMDANGDDSVILVRDSDDDELNVASELTPSSSGSNRPLAKRRRIEIAEPCIDDFDLVKTIGSGAFGRVFLVKFRGNARTTNGEGFFYAMKSFKKTRLLRNPNEYKHTLTELRVLSNACVKEHPFIVKFVCSFHSAERVFLVTEFIPGGELFQLISRREKLPEDEARFYLAELTLALEFLHRLGVIYRDLKPENVLINSDGHVKLIDFGLVKDRLKSEAHISYGTYCGTREYMAPEVAERKPYGVACDWWTLGALAYDLIVGEYPYTPDDYNRPIEYPKHTSRPAKKFLRELLAINPTYRLGSPVRGGSNSVKKHAFFESFNWNDVFMKRLKPPFVPSVSANDDLTHIDIEFLKQPAILSTTSEDELGKDPPFDQDFANFSYVNPNF